MRILLLLACFSVAACQSPAPKPALAYVNSIRLMQGYHGTQAQRQVLEKQGHRWQQSLDSLTTVLGTSGLPAAEQQVRVGRYRLTLQNKVQAASQRADQELVREVNQYLQQYGQQHHYAFILGATESGNIVYAAPEEDITNEVLQGLNQRYDQRRAPRP